MDFDHLRISFSKGPPESPAQVPAFEPSRLAHITESSLNSFGKEIPIFPEYTVYIYIGTVSP